MFVQKVDLFPLSKNCYCFFEISFLDITFKQFKIRIIVKWLHWRKKKISEIKENLSLSNIPNLSAFHMILPFLVI